MRRSSFSQSPRASPARDECVAAHGTEQNQLRRVGQLIDSALTQSCLAAFLLFYFILFYCKWASVFSPENRLLCYRRHCLPRTSNTLTALSKTHLLSAAQLFPDRPTVCNTSFVFRYSDCR